MGRPTASLDMVSHVLSQWSADIGNGIPPGVYFFGVLSNTPAAEVQSRWGSFLGSCPRLDVASVDAAFDPLAVDPEAAAAIDPGSSGV